MHRTRVKQGKNPDRYLKPRSGVFYYQRRVPTDCQALDNRGLVVLSLKTRDADLARLKRDAQEEADDMYWSGLAAGGEGKDLLSAYEDAKKRARSLGFIYRSAVQSATDTPVSELLSRINVAKDKTPEVAAAVLGGVPEPKISLNAALEIYDERIASAELLNHSPKQRKQWVNGKRRAIRYFIEAVGDVPVMEISRADAKKFWTYWDDKIKNDGLDPDTARRSIGDLSKLLSSYAKFMGVEKPNPFAGLTFRKRNIGKGKKVPAFSADWITTKLLQPSGLASLNSDARRILFAMIETGCRPSELCNIRPENIMLDAPIPHLRMRYYKRRSLKAAASERDVPLIGVSLAAMRAAPEGFERYRDKEDSLSAMLNKHLDNHGLFETPSHVVYSVRHGFEKRMLEAGLDFGFRCMIIGHAMDRPEYGDGGSLAWRRDQLNKIILPFDPTIV